MAIPIILVGGTEEKVKKKIAELKKGYLNPADFLDFRLTTKEETGIQNALEFQTWLAVTAKAGNRRLLVISFADSLTVEAQNCLLKTLEEPPANSQIILVSKNLDCLLLTVQSRCEMVLLGNHPIQTDRKMQEKTQKILQLLADQNYGHLFTISEEISKTRDDSLALIDHIIVSLREELPNEISAFRLERLLKARNYLMAKTNIRLVLENLFLNW